MADSATTTPWQHLLAAHKAAEAEMRARGKVHNAAEIAYMAAKGTPQHAAAKAREEEADVPWVASVDACNEARLAICRFETTDPDRIAFKMAMFSADPMSDWTAEYAEIIAATESALRRRSDAFSAAMEAHAAADRAMKDAEAAMDNRHALIELEAPRPDNLEFERVTDLEAARLPLVTKAYLLPELQDWLEKKASAETRHPEPVSEEEMGRLDEARCDAMYEFLRQPAPDAAGFAAQLRAILNRAYADDFGDDADDGLFISRMITRGETALNEGAPIAVLYQSALRAAERHTPALDARPFEPKVWIAYFEAEAIAGVRITGSGPAYYEPEGGPVTATHPPADWCDPWRALRPWQRDLVLREARQRQKDERKRAA